MRVLPVMNTNYKNHKSAASTQPSFNGLLPKAITAFWAAPAENLLDASFKTNAINSTEEALLDLMQKQSGAIVKTAAGFIPIPYEKFVTLMKKPSEECKGISEIVFKRPMQKFWDENLRTQYDARIGIIPSNVLSFLQTGATKITAICDNGIEELSISANSKTRQKAFEYFKQTGELVKQDNLGFDDIYGNKEYFFSLVEQMVARARVFSDITGLEARRGFLPGREEIW